MLLSFDQKSPTQLLTNLGKLMKSCMEKEGDIEMRNKFVHTNDFIERLQFSNMREVRKKSIEITIQETFTNFV